MQDPVISVIIPVWGAEKTLGRCVDSVLSQTVEGGLCCILVDDGGPDRSGELCEEYAAQDVRVKVIHKSDSGVSGARNAGLALAESEYVVFLDSDDALRPGALQAALDAQAAAPDCMVLWHYTTALNDTSVVTDAATLAPRSALAQLYLDCLIAMPWNKLYRRELAQQLSFNTAYTLGEDLQFVLDYIAALGHLQPGFRYAVLDSALTYYDCSRPDGTLSTRYHPEYCDIWPVHFSKLNDACAAAAVPAADLLPLHRAELRVYAEGVADILRRDPLQAGGLRRDKARTALANLWLRDLLNHMKAERCYSPYYLPCRWNNLQLLFTLCEANRTGNPLYGKLDWGGYYLLLGRMKRT